MLDSVGAGASRLRTETALRLLGTGAVTILLALAGAGASGKGVDSNASVGYGAGRRRHLAVRYDCAVVVSGATDHCLDRTRAVRFSNGTPLMARKGARTPSQE